MRVKIRSIAPEARASRRHVAADIRQQRDQRGLAHERRFTAHVRAGDQQQLARALRVGVVGDELLDLRFDHRMPSLARCRCPRRRRTAARDPVERGGAFGEGGQQIEFGERGGDALAVAG